MANDTISKIHITYFVHGTTIDNETDRATGWHQGELSELGIRQSIQLRDHLKDRKFDVIISSDLKRAIDSADLSFPGQKIIHDARLRECNYGTLNGAPSHEIESRMHSAIKTPFPDGEAYGIEVQNRIADLLTHLKKNYQGKSVALVAHRAPQLALDVLVHGKSWEQAMKEDWRHTKSWKPGWSYTI